MIVEQQLRTALFASAGIFTGALLIVFGLLDSNSHAQHQTAEFTPILPGSDLPYRIEVREYDFGSAALPGIHSYAAGIHEGKWLIIAGRTNGVHDLDQSGQGSFPPESQNREVWVIDPVSRESWHRSLGDPVGGAADPVSGLTPNQIASLTLTNNQFSQVGHTLYMAGGYGLDENDVFTTFGRLSAIDLPGLMDWVISGDGRAVDSIRQLDDPIASVTGGAMHAIDGRMHIVFGQDFQGPYSPRSEGTYTRQVRSFDIVDDGVNLAIQNPTSTPIDPAYRRRDINVIPILKPDGLGGSEAGLVALSGVFTSAFGVWTVPVEIDANGVPTMADPDLPTTFKQGFNGYHSAKLGLYSAASGDMHEILFGGISLQFRDPQTGQTVTDHNMPFVNDITAISIDSSGEYSQYHVGYFPEILDDTGTPWRFGANAEFFVADGVTTFSNGIINRDVLGGTTTLGYIYGGIMTNGPHTQGFPDVTSTAASQIFEVVYVVVPEPATWLLVAVGMMRWGWASRRNATRGN